MSFSNAEPCDAPIHLHFAQDVPVSPSTVCRAFDQSGRGSLRIFPQRLRFLTKSKAERDELSLVNPRQ
jgi:hypothetical protein